jgi:MFS transporter, Spinster family, sphingosine-1-phosphate transporter
MSPVSRGNAWGLLAALTFLNILNFADRFLLFAFSTAIVPELQLTNLEFGLLTGVVFTGVYVVFGVFAGSLADRMHRPRLIAAGLALWSALTAVTGLARTFWQMAAARLFIGVGEASLTPASLSLLAERFPPSRRALAGGIYYMGYPLGIGGSLIFAGIAGPALGWRGSFALLGVLGIVAAALVFALVRDPQREGKRKLGQPAHGGSFADSFRGIGHELRTNSAFTLTLLGSTLICFALGAGILDLLWWVKERGYTASEAQKVLGLLFLLGGTAGAFLGGIGGDWAQKRHSAGRLRFLAGAFLFLAPAVALYRIVPGHTPLFYAMAFSASVATLLVFGPALSAVQDLVPAQHRASAVSVWLLCAALPGGAAGNAAVGWLADRFIAAGLLEPLTLALVVMQTAGALAIPAFYLAARAQERARFSATVIAHA